MERLLRKFDTAKELVPRPVQERSAKKPTKYGVIYFGSTAPAMDEAILALIEGAATHARSHARPRLPVPSSVNDFIADHDFVFVVEQNRDAQMRTLIVNECGIDPVEAGAGPALRRHADHRALHRERHRRSHLDHVEGKRGR